MPQPTKAAPDGLDTGKRHGRADADRGDGGPDAVRDPGKAVERLVLSEDRLKLLADRVPVLKGARVLEELAIVRNSRLVRSVLCLDTSVEESTSQLLRQYRTAKWSEITVHTPGHDGNRRSVTAHSEHFRLIGTVSQGDFRDCKKTKGQSRIALSFQERNASQPPARIAPITN